MVNHLSAVSLSQTRKLNSGTAKQHDKLQQARRTGSTQGASRVGKLKMIPRRGYAVQSKSKTGLFTRGECRTSVAPSVSRSSLGALASIPKAVKPRKPDSKRKPHVRRQRTARRSCTGIEWELKKSKQRWWKTDKKRLAALVAIADAKGGRKRKDTDHPRLNKRPKCWFIDPTVKNPKGPKKGEVVVTSNSMSPEVMKSAMKAKKKRCKHVRSVDGWVVVAEGHSKAEVERNIVAGVLKTLPAVLAWHR